MASQIILSLEVNVSQPKHVTTQSPNSRIASQRQLPRKLQRAEGSHRCVTANVQNHKRNRHCGAWENNVPYCVEVALVTLCTSTCMNE